MISRMDMMEDYVRPIEITMQKEIETKIENEVLKATVKAGINVNAEELKAALRNDEERFWQGYLAGYNRRDSQIVTCENCANRNAKVDSFLPLPCQEMETPDDWYCASAQRKDEEC